MLVGVMCVESLSGGTSVAAHVAQEGPAASVKTFPFPVIGDNCNENSRGITSEHRKGTDSNVWSFCP